MARETWTENPYEPTSTITSRPPYRTRWIRKLVFLNGVLLLLPISLCLYGYILLRTELARQANKWEGKYTTYDPGFIGFEGPSFPIVIVYFLLPNLLLLGWTGARLRHDRKRPGVD